MTNIERIIIGALGGLSAVLVKFLGQDYANVVAHVANLSPDQLLSYKIGYGLLTPILMFLGAVIAWASEEEKRVKLIALAIAAPALITTWSGGTKATEPPQVSVDFFISSAYAQSAQAGTISGNPVDPGANTEKSALDQIKDGVGIFFGYGKEPARYWVVVGSYKDREAAQQFADKINAESKALNAWVGLKIPPNEYYPVIVGDYSLLSDAKALRDRALATQSIKEAYLSTGVRR